MSSSGYSDQSEYPRGIAVETLFGATTLAIDGPIRVKGINFVSTVVPGIVTVTNYAGTTTLFVAQQGNTKHTRLLSFYTPNGIKISSTGAHYCTVTYEKVGG
jgi:hypothetical protein